ncbi:hypothetical protein EJ04DRAFT_274530 [Polyplosphaeria fusca]|uniref:Uncharacterized protein n=1 Tax=Polyplosphaeria fusca TaxID=682080 RepID=A0A9P4QY76_9PLEO|nr:hypothetical protein EJ04DRAFT_274530 [Polyplosphaeria fusca]
MPIDLQTIDLTFSSDDDDDAFEGPPPRNPTLYRRPPPIHAPSSAAVNIKRESSSRPRVPPPPASNHGATRIEHVKRIILTSNSDAIRTVLLNLCNISPNLCGAIARGLAPHSTYAQSTITHSGQSYNAAAPNNRPENSSIGGSSQRPVIKNEYSGRPSHGAAHHNRLDNPGVGSSSQPSATKREPDAIRSQTQAPYGRVKQEPGANTLQTSQRTAPRNPPRSEPSRPQPTRSDLDASSFSARPHPGYREPLSSAETNLPSQRHSDTSSTATSKPTTHICAKCNEPFTARTNGVCLYHPRVLSFDAGTGNPIYPICDCCELPASAPGCTLGKHTPLVNDPAPLDKRRHSDADDFEPSSFRQSSKFAKFR